MINSLIKIPDNISTSFEVVDGNFILGAPEPTFQGLDQTHIGFHIPYYAKNLLLGVNGPAYEWEIGIGKVITTTVIDRVKVIKSSSNTGVDGFVQFTFGGTKTFSVYPNEYNLNIAFNNIINATGNFNLSNIKSTILVDLSQSSSNAYLPVASGNDGLILDFKSYNQLSNNTLTIIPSGSDTVDGSNELVIDNNNVYTRLISDGSGWVQLKNETNVNLSVEGIGLPQGENLSLQYKVSSGELGGSNLFAVNSGLLIGSPTQSSAQHILSNNSNNIINNKSLNVDFLVKGSGNKNLIFSSTGKLGLNIPSGYSPNSLLHLVSSNCDASVRIENRNNCVDALPSIVLNHRPTTTINSNSNIGRLSYTAKNSAGTSTTYADIRSKAINSTAGYTSGQLIFSVDNTGNLIDILSLNKDKVNISIEGSSLSVDKSQIKGEYDASLNNIYCKNIVINNLTGTNNILYGNSSGLLSSLPLDVHTISVSGHTHDISDISQLSGTISELYLYTDNSINNISGILQSSLDDKIDLSNPSFITGVITPYVLSSNLDSVKIDLINQNLDGNWKKNNTDILSADTSNPSFSGYLLTHNGNAVSWKQFNPYNYIFDGIDLKWNKYLNRNCNILSGGTYINIYETDVSQEFFVGDTVKVSISGTNYLRTIQDVSTQDDTTTFTMNQSVPIIGSGTIFSISNGGYLELSVDPITAPDVSPKIILSTRPNQDTIFNQTKADLGFKIYGVNNSPILDISSSGNVSVNGNLFSINANLYANSLQLGSVSVPSGYILTSSTGNIAQWSPQTNINDLDGGIIVFSGVGVV